MSQPDFKVDPLSYIYARLAEIESDLIDANFVYLAGNQDALDRVRELLDLIRPTIISDKANQ